MFLNDQSQHQIQTKEHNSLISKPYKLINIGPVNNNFLIPTKIKSPFDDDPDQSDQIIYNIIDEYLSENPPDSFPIQNFSSLLLTAVSNQRNVIYTTISQKIIKYTIESSEKLLSLTDFSSIISMCVNILSSILNFSNFFEFIQADRPFSKIFYESFHKNIYNNSSFIGLLSSIVSEIFINSLNNNVPLNQNEQYIILFIENTNLFTDYFINTISQNLSNFFGMNMLQNNTESNMKDKYCLLFQSFHILYNSMPKSASIFLKLISKPFTIDVIGQRADDFISSVGEVVFYHQDQINTFFAVIDPSTPKTAYATFAKSMVNEEINMEKMANLHRFIGKQSIHMRHIVERFLKKRLQRYDKQAIISFTKLIDHEFRSGKYCSDIISELSLIQDKFCFEAAHSVLMMRRAIDIDFEFDKRFAEEYNEFYNDNHSENFMLIVKDVEESNSLYQNFLNENSEVPSFLSIHVFFWQNWKHHNFEKYKFPNIIQPYIDSFTQFIREKNPKKKLNWKLDLSDCTLSLGAFSIRCDGVAGAILLSLNDSPKTADEIKKEICDSPDFDVEAILSQYIDQKGGKIIEKYIENTQTFFKINKNVVIDHESDDEIKIITHLPYPDERNSNQNMHLNFYNIISKTTQIDGLIMSTLKEREMTNDDLISTIRELVTYPVESEIIQERIDHMERRNFISHDSINDNKYHYVP